MRMWLSGAWSELGKVNTHCYGGNNLSGERDGQPSLLRLRYIKEKNEWVLECTVTTKKSNAFLDPN